MTRRIKFLLMLGAAAWLSASGARAADTAAFLERHWARPLPAQGLPPAGFSALEASLDPSACGGCHRAQFDEWRTSLHARSMGPGVLGQLLAMSANARDEHQACLRCHAPLAEQAASLVDVLRKRERSGLHQQGLVCAACHLRGHTRYGPPRRDGSSPGPGEQLPHAGWRAAPAFEDSRFCAACHQFEPDGFALNGKLLENTFEEWRSSRHAREGRSCQSCHMPDRSHLWRGIHDPAMVQAGVTLTVREPAVADGRIRAALRLVNTGTGHAFPTYVTPRVDLQIFQADRAGRPLPGTRRSYRIGRQVPLDLSREISDTRVPPDGEAALTYEAPAHRQATVLVYRVRVEPDAFYAGFYRDLLNAGTAGPGRKLIEQALAAANASAYTLFEKQHPLYVKPRDGRTSPATSSGPKAPRD